MPRRSLWYCVLFVQAELLLLLALKIYVFPGLAWMLFGVSSAAALFNDLSAIMLGTVGIVLLGWTGYYHAHRFVTSLDPVKSGVYTVFLIHFPLIGFIFYKWFAGVHYWDTWWSLLLSSWLALVAHPLHLVGLFGDWVDAVSVITLGACYLTGLFLGLEEWKARQTLPIRKVVDEQ